jgi:hypothetical protein
MYSFYEPRAIGGWLILPVIGFIATAISATYYLFTAGFFSDAIWHVYDGQPQGFQYKLLLWLEFSYNTVLACLAVFCLVLIYYKRDIMPMFAKMLYIGSLVAVVVDNVWVHALVPSTPIDFKDIFRSIVGVCIWVPYFTVADRVKETFVIAYPDVHYEMKYRESVVIEEPEEGDIVPAAVATEALLPDPGTGDDTATGHPS